MKVLRGDEIVIRKILLPIDVSRDAVQSVRYGADVALRLPKAELCLLHVGENRADVRFGYPMVPVDDCSGRVSAVRPLVLPGKTSDPDTRIKKHLVPRSCRHIPWYHTITEPNKSSWAYHDASEA